MQTLRAGVWVGTRVSLHHPYRRIGDAQLQPQPDVSAGRHKCLLGDYLDGLDCELAERQGVRSSVERGVEAVCLVVEEGRTVGAVLENEILDVTLGEDKLIQLAHDRKCDGDVGKIIAASSLKKRPDLGRTAAGGGGRSSEGVPLGTSDREPSSSKVWIASCCAVRPRKQPAWPPQRPLQRHPPRDVDNLDIYRLCWLPIQRVH
mmetsp:Transcript_14594/g.34091  ORF Transcript_14594/g.34091 Transcript_14594/m.34091 type:complete len:204 (-) Transcript_14594:181-792(-)